VDRAYLRGGLGLGHGVWEELLDALVVRTRSWCPPDSSMAPRQEAVHNDWSGPLWCPVPATASARYVPAVDAFLAEVARAGQTRDEEAPDEEGPFPRGGVDSSSLTLAQG
jgi:hypothetical protein